MVRTHNESEVDVEQAAVSTQHKVVQVAITHAQDVGHDAIPCTAAYKGVQRSRPPCMQFSSTSEFKLTEHKHKVNKACQYTAVTVFHAATKLAILC